MATVNVKYLKDESGNIISPVTGAKNVYLNATNSIIDFIGTSVRDKGETTLPNGLKFKWR